MQGTVGARHELSRTGARTTQAPTVSLDGAVQAMTRASLDPSGNYAATVDYPRDPLDTGPFGPLWPLHVQAINPPRSDTGQPEPRVWEYPTGFNLPGTGDRLLPWEVLRAASTNVDVIRRCIEIRKDDVRTLEGSWNVSEKAIKAAQEADPTKPRDEIEAALRKEFADDIERLTGFWERPWITNGVRFGQWVAAVMEDHIVLDAVAIYPVTTVGGDVVAFRVVDGSTIKLLINLDGERPQPPYAAFQQILAGFPRGEYLSDVVLAEDGSENTSPSFTARQITYWRENFRTYTPYGLSQVEQALVSAALYLKRQGWMHSEYDEGSTPLTWLVPEGDKFVASQQSPAQRREYETAINDDLEGQIGKRHRIKVSYPGFKPEQMSSVDERYKPEYDRFLVNMLIGHMGVTMDRFGLTETKGLGATGQHERQAEVQDDSGVHPDVKMIQDLVLELSRNYLDSPLELTFTLIKPKKKDEEAESSVVDVQRKNGTISQNEGRKKLGYQPLSMPEADMPSMVTATGVVYLEGGAEKQAEMDAAAVELAKNPPVPGSTPGAPGRGPAGGSGGTGGSKPKPTGPKPAGPANKAAGDAEVAAYHRWVHKQAGRGIPARPFRFEVATPDAFPLEMHDGRWMAFEGYEWRQDITKDWRAWNAAHPLHPRGPHGRFVKVGNLVDELRRTHGPLSDMHENELDEAARRTAAGRHIRRGQSQLADDLERHGLLEEYGGRGGNKGKLEISEAGRRHLAARWDDGGEVTPEPGSAPEPTPPEPEPESDMDRGRRVRAAAEAAGEAEELASSGADLDTIRERAQRAGVPGIEDATSAEQIRDAARAHARANGLTPVGEAGASVAYDPSLHTVVSGSRRPEPGDPITIVRPGFTMTDDSAIAVAMYGEGHQTLVSRAVVADLAPEKTSDAPSAPELTPAQRREQLRAERLAAREQRRGIAAAPEPTSHGQPTEDPGTVAGMTTPAPKRPRRSRMTSMHLTAEQEESIKRQQRTRLQQYREESPIEEYNGGSMQWIGSLGSGQGGYFETRAADGTVLSNSPAKFQARQRIDEYNAAHTPAAPEAATPDVPNPRDFGNFVLTNDEIWAMRVAAMPRNAKIGTAVGQSYPNGEGPTGWSTVRSHHTLARKRGMGVSTPNDGRYAGDFYIRDAERHAEAFRAEQAWREAGGTTAAWRAAEPEAATPDVPGREVSVTVGPDGAAHVDDVAEPETRTSADLLALATKHDAMAAQWERNAANHSGDRSTAQPDVLRARAQANRDEAAKLRALATQRQEPTPAPAEHPQREVFDKLLDEGRVKHKQARQIVEQLEAHGWKLTGQNPMMKTTDWEAPDGRTLSVQFLTDDKPKFYSGAGNRSPLTYRAALAHVVTPTHEEIGEPNIQAALEEISPDLAERLDRQMYGSVMGTRDTSLDPLDRAIRELSGYGSTRRRTHPEVAASLREQADRLEVLAQSNEDYRPGELRSRAETDRIAEQRERAVQFRQVADIMDRQAAERQAYEAERDRRATLPLDIRPGRSVKPSAVASARKPTQEEWIASERSRLAEKAKAERVVADAERARRAAMTDDAVVVALQGESLIIPKRLAKLPSMARETAPYDASGLRVGGISGRVVTDEQGRKIGSLADTVTDEQVTAGGWLRVDTGVPVAMRMAGGGEFRSVSVYATPSADPAGVRDRLYAAQSREEAGKIIDSLDLKLPELRQLARDLDIPVRSGAPKSDVRDTIVALTAGRRLDSLAINPGPTSAERQLISQTEHRARLAERLKQADIMYGTDRSTWPERERRDRERIVEQMAALDRQIQAARKRR